MRKKKDLDFSDVCDLLLLCDKVVLMVWFTNILVFSSKVCNVAPIPGETKVWKYITLTNRIHLIDSPGVVYKSSDSETDVVLKGVVCSTYVLP